MNDEYWWLSFVYLTAAVIFLSSNFWGQRFQFGQTVRLALLWLGIFIVAFVIVDNRFVIGRALGILPPETEQGPPPPSETTRSEDIA